MAGEQASGSSGVIDHRRGPAVPGVAAVYAYESVDDTPASDRPPHRGLPSTSLTLVVAVD